MSRILTLFVIALSASASMSAVADVSATNAAAPNVANKAAGPCQQIVAACKNAGFVAGDAKQGIGLWVDCVDPIMSGSGQPSKAVKPLPSVAPAAVAACKAKDPNFGKGKQAPPK